MEYRRLGDSGTVVSRLALGSMYCGGETSEQDAFAIIDAYVAVAAPISGARSGGAAAPDLGTAELHLDAEATAALETSADPRRGAIRTVSSARRNERGRKTARTR